MKAAALVALSFVIGSAEADVTREGSGARRATLNEMELQPFPASAWAGLAGWTNGEELTETRLSGKPVLILTWASWYPTSLKALPVASRMQKKYGDDGLVVVGVHHDEGWEDAERVAKSRRAEFTIVHDAGNALRDALHVDQDPDFYVIDRAGHLRFADIDTSSVEAAVQEVVAESESDARSLPQRLEADRVAADLASRRTGQISAAADLVSLPPVPPGFAQPEADAYEKAHWPKKPDLGRMNRSSRRNDDAPPQRIAFPAEGFLPSRPVTAGRIGVVYFWDLEERITFDRVMTSMDRLQRQHGREIVVCGVLTQFESNRRRRDQDPGLSEEEVARRLNRFVNDQHLEHVLLDGRRTVPIPSNGQRGGNRDWPAAPVALVSSDGLVRWLGWFDHPEFDSALHQMLNQDPGLQNLREADRRFIEGHN